MPPIFPTSIRTATFAVVVLACAHAMAQPSSTDAGEGVRVTGVASVSIDQYSIAGTNLFVTNRQPRAQLRILFAPTFTAGEISVPVTVSLAGVQSNILTPVARTQTLAQLLENPTNVVQIAPRYKWAQVFLGTVTPLYSDLSVGNAPLFGAAVDLHPGALHVGAFAGTQQRAVDADSVNLYTGAYARRLYGLTLGNTFENKATLHLNVVRMSDDPTSAKVFGKLPQAGTLVSISAVTDVDRLAIRGEIAGGSFTSDARTGAADSLTKFRLAAFAQASYAERTWDVNARIRYLGDGFIPLGYLFQPTDYAEITVSPSMRLWDNHVIVSATVGFHGDNMSGTKVSSAHTMISSFDGIGKLDSTWSVRLAFSNFGMRIVAADSVPAIRTTSNAVTLAPEWRRTTDIGTHSVIASILFDRYSDESISTGAITANDTRTLALSYALAFSTTPLTLRATISQYLNHLSLGPLTVTTFMVSATRPFFDGMLTPTVDLAYASNVVPWRSADAQILFRFAVTSRIGQHLDGTLRGTLNLYNYGVTNGVPNARTSSLTEEYVQSVFSYRF